MRIIPLTAVTVLALGMVGCASSSGTSNYQQDLARLEASCKAKDGVLVPSSAPQSGTPSNDYGCRIVGPASRIPPSGN